MSNPWNTAPVLEKEPELSEIMSEELSQRLQIEDDFVWVNLPEVQQIKDIVPPTISDELSTANESSISQTLVKIVQSEVNIGDEEVTEIIYYDEDPDIWDTIQHPDRDQVDDWECKIDFIRPVNIFKCNPPPQRLKHNITTRINAKTKENKQADTVDTLVPKIDLGERTNALLKRLIDDRYIGWYDDVVGTGKNSVVFHARNHRLNCITMTFYNAVKVYKLNDDDDTTEAVFKRVEQEFEHLSIVWNKLRSVPEPFRAWDNAIMMRFIGYEQYVAPSIKDCPVYEEMYLKIVRFIDNCYNHLHLVHGKLCVKNIRYYTENPYILGWGHSVKSDHPQALLKLIKDCHFVTKFYSKRGFKLKSTEELFTEITGITKISRKLLDSVRNKNLFEKYDNNPNRKHSSPIKSNGNLRFK